MTPHQVLVVAALGGLAALLSVIVVFVLGAALYVGAHHFFQAREDRRQEHDERQAVTDLDTCRAIDALGTTRDPDHPTH